MSTSLSYIYSRHTKISKAISSYRKMLPTLLVPFFLVSTIIARPLSYVNDVDFEVIKDPASANTKIENVFGDGNYDFDYSGGRRAGVDLNKPIKDSNYLSANGETNANRPSDEGISITTHDGSSTIMNSDGTVTSTLTDGRVVHRGPQGVISILYPNGVSMNVNSDSTITWKNKKGETLIPHEDGTSTTLHADGSTTTPNKDGKITITYPDGTTETKKDPDAQNQEGGTENTKPSPMQKMAVFSAGVAAGLWGTFSDEGISLLNGGAEIMKTICALNGGC